MAFIHCKNLNYIYNSSEENQVIALNNINLDIAAGSFVVILGANGSGKSTLARHFNGLLQPTAGNCQVNGIDTLENSRLWEIRQQVGMVFQNPDNQLIAAVVEDDIAFGAENLGVPPQEIKQRVTEALQAVGMEEYRSFAPHLLSGGQKQRIAIAGALAMQTKCLVLDEPTAMLDPKGRREVMHTITRLNKEKGITVIHITHFMEEAVMADRVIVMDGGRIIADGTPREIFRQARRLKELGLTIPHGAEMAILLKNKGLKLPEGIVTDEELVAALGKYSRSR